MELRNKKAYVKYLNSPTPINEEENKARNKAKRVVRQS